MQPGDLITVHALRADGRWYRRWQTTVESVTDTCVITFSPDNSTVEDTSRGAYTQLRALRTYYWLDRPYNLIEVIHAEGSIGEIYVNVASAPRFTDGEMHYVDHELDVSKLAGQPARIVDQDEFEAAVAQYGYTATFQEQCWRAAEEARLLAETWEARRVARTMERGDQIDVHVLHADGQRYRSWHATVERIDDKGIVASRVEEGRVSRGYYWFDRMFNLFEEFDADGLLAEVYVNIASPPTLAVGELSFVDHELDVALEPGGEPELWDEDEFDEAIVRYGYTPEFQARCRRAAEDAVEFVRQWPITNRQA
jgi:protein associated with RNAse G/E